MAITHIPVQGQSANLAKRIVLVRPDLGHVKDVPLVGFSILGIHDLDINIPNRIVLSLNGLVQILEQEVWVLAGYFSGLLLGEVLNPLLSFDVHFDVFERAVLILC